MIWPWLLRNEPWGLQPFKRQWGLPVATRRGWLSHPQTEGWSSHELSECTSSTVQMGKQQREGQSEGRTLSFFSLMDKWAQSLHWNLTSWLLTGDKSLCGPFPDLEYLGRHTLDTCSYSECWWGSDPLPLPGCCSVTPDPSHCQSPCPVLICKSGHLTQNTVCRCFPCQVWI